MITLRKLEGLPPRTRGRKLLALLAEEHDLLYDAGLVRLAREFLGHDHDKDQMSKTSVPSGRDRAHLRIRLAQVLGIEVADWDLQAPPDRGGIVTRFPFHVWLDDLRSPFNVGSILRTAEAYGFSSVRHTPLTPGAEHPRTLRTAMGAEQHLVTGAVTLDELRRSSGDLPVFALELGGTPISEFAFPAKGLVLVGGEELGLSPEALEWAESSAGRVSLPLYGQKASLNVGVAFGILAAAWTAAQTKKDHPEGWSPD